MKRLLTFLFCLLALAPALSAQVPVAVVQSVCNGQSLTANNSTGLTVDLKGNACISALIQDGQTVTVSGASSTTIFKAGVMGAAVAVSATTSLPFGTTTTLLQGMHCNNTSTSAVTFSASDGNTAFFIGPNFSIPALGFVDLPPGVLGHPMTSGIKLSASAAVVNCWVEGKQ